MRTICALLLVFCALGSGCKKRAASTGSGDKDTSAPKGGPGKLGTFTIGKSTTYVTGPVEKDGHIDYAEALNERLSQGVTAENNANVAIWRALGPNPAGGGKLPPGYFEKLGIQPPPATGDYFIAIRQHAQSGGPGAANAASEAMTRYSSRPWTATDNATLQGWLRANEKPMAALAEAVTKTHYYNPLVPEKNEKGSRGLINALLPGTQACREVAAAFACRAMLYVGHNQPAAAWQDLLTCHRLGRLVGRGATLLEGLVGMAIEQIACRGEVAFLDRAKPDATTVETCIRDLFVLPPMPDVSEKIDVSERFVFLDLVTQVDKQGLGYLESMGDGRQWAKPFGASALDGIDWDPALETANRWFDRMAAGAREKDRRVRMQKLNQCAAELDALKTVAADPGRVNQLIQSGRSSAKAKGEAVGDVLITLLMPAAPKVVDASDRTHQTFDNTAVAFALVWYQRRNGRYPDALAKLAPDFLTAVPPDVFSGRDLIYRPAASGFVLYSVGVNGIDDGGRGYDSQPPGDDLVVRVPVPPGP